MMKSLPGAPALPLGIFDGKGNVFLLFMVSKINFDGKGKTFLVFYLSKTSFEGIGNVFIAFCAFQDQL